MTLADYPRPISQGSEGSFYQHYQAYNKSVVIAPDPASNGKARGKCLIHLKEYCLRISMGQQFLQ